MSNFTELDVITDEESAVIAVITYKMKPNGEKIFSFSFMREFDDAGTFRRTCWLNHWHIPAIDRLMPKVQERLRIEEEKARVERRRGTKSEYDWK